HRKIGSGDFQRIPAEPFCYCSAQTDPGQVPEKNLALVFLSSHINKKNKKQEQIPDACVQKKRVGLNVYGISNCNKMLLKPSREQTLRNNFRGDLHGDRVICIGTEKFSVEKAA